MYTLSSEQDFSLAEVLTEAGVRHGDTVEVDLVVGVHPQSGGVRGAHLAFCPSVVRAGRVIKHGDAHERSLPIGGRVVFDDPEGVAKHLHGHRGFALMKAILHTNGNMTLSVVRGSLKREVAPINQEQFTRSSLGKPFAEAILLKA